MKLYEKINTDNWYQGGFKSKDLRRSCLMMHLIEMYGFQTTIHRQRVHDAIQTLYPERMTYYCGISGFNDHPETTVDDVTRVCKFADA